MMQLYSDSTFESQLFEATNWENYILYMANLIAQISKRDINPCDFFSPSTPFVNQIEDKSHQSLCLNKKAYNNSTSICPKQLITSTEFNCVQGIKHYKQSIDTKEQDKDGLLFSYDYLQKKKSRNAKLCSGCPHHFSRHYAKNMCSNCYHSKGRVKKPWNCPHTTKTHYALGLCQNCYQMNYTKGKKDSTNQSSGSQVFN